MALGFEATVAVWAEDAPDQLISHPDRPKPPDRRRRSSNPAEIMRFLKGG